MSSGVANTSGIAQPATTQSSLAGKYLTFFLMEEEYALKILKVQEIFGMLDFTRIPMTPEHMLGLINLRGKVIPIVDLRRKFNMGMHEKTAHSCIIVCQVRNASIGIVVDRVNEVADINSDEIEETPNLGPGVRNDFLMGIGKTGDRVRLLLDIEAVLTTRDVEEISAAIQSGEEVSAE